MLWSCGCGSSQTGEAELLSKEEKRTEGRENKSAEKEMSLVLGFLPVILCSMRAGAEVAALGGEPVWNGESRATESRMVGGGSMQRINNHMKEERAGKKGLRIAEKPSVLIDWKS